MSGVDLDELQLLWNDYCDAFNNCADSNEDRVRLRDRLDVLRNTVLDALPALLAELRAARELKLRVDLLLDCDLSTLNEIDLASVAMLTVARDEYDEVTK